MSETKLHLGCGKRYLKGYLHVDLSNHPHINQKHDIKTLPMFKDNSIDLIYCCHVIGYFDRFEIIEVFKEWQRVLRKGGILRLALPDFKALLDVYNEYNDLNLLLNSLYGRLVIPGSDKIIYYKTTYDFSAINDLLESVGFSNVRRWDWRKVFVGELAGYDDYSQAYIPHMDKEYGRLISLNVECEK